MKEYLILFIIKEVWFKMIMKYYYDKNLKVWDDIVLLKMYGDRKVYKLLRIWIVVIFFEVIWYCFLECILIE